jgi:aryl-phospho-beta-D-glucosidase BglC (GH1 family)
MSNRPRRRDLLGALLSGGALAACTGGRPMVPPLAGPPPSERTGPPLSTGPFRFLVARDGGIAFDDGTPAVLRGFAFGNEVYSNDRMPVNHHDARDFARLRAMGMNLVRFYMHYRTFESEAAPYQYLDDGWDWLDRNVGWARQHGVYLILNLHVPQGGYQSTGKGTALWAVRDNQLRLIALWRAIARRYASEPVIAGYDLVNEPVVPHARSEWQQLAQAIARAIRGEDNRHPVVVERVNAVAGDWSNDAMMNFVTIDDPNVIYTFHLYDPFDYTHQYASWVPYLSHREGGTYPNGAGRDRAWLQQRMQAYLAWARHVGAALYLGEFGAIRACFERRRGGLNWVADVADLATEAGIPWTYHVWHEDNFGLYAGHGSLPDPAHANQPMIDLLTRKFAG